MLHATPTVVPPEIYHASNNIISCLLQDRRRGHITHHLLAIFNVSGIGLVIILVRLLDLQHDINRG